MMRLVFGVKSFKAELSRGKKNLSLGAIFLPLDWRNVFDFYRG